MFLCSVFPPSGSFFKVDVSKCCRLGRPAPHEDFGFDFDHPNISNVTFHLGKREKHKSRDKDPNTIFTFKLSILLLLLFFSLQHLSRRSFPLFTLLLPLVDFRARSATMLIQIKVVLFFFLYLFVLFTFFGWLCMQ